MRVAIMQPYFYPYVGYFELLAHVDQLVLYDDVQFIRRGWVNRNRIRSLQDPCGWQYLTVPVERAPRATSIRDIRLHSDREWVRKQRLTLESVFGEQVRENPLYRSFLTCAESAGSSLCDYLEQTLVDAAALLKLPLRMERASALDVDPALRGQDRILALCERLDADTYVNLPGGQGLYQREAFARRGLGLEILEPSRYRGCDDRPSTLSVLDLVLGDGMDALRRHLTTVAPRSRPALPQPAFLETNLETSP